MGSDHVFICVLTDEEIDKIRKCQTYYPGDSFTNVLTGLALEAADRRIEDAEMLERMNEEYEKSEKYEQSGIALSSERDRSEKDCMWEGSRAYVL